MSYIFLDVFIPSLNEEILFRSIFIGILVYNVKLGRLSSVVLSALIFAACHNGLNNGVFLLSLFLTGIIYGLAFTSVSGGIITAIVCHFLWNIFPIFVPL
jgi:membrane protease YdiL (CAAX protease family)